MDAKVLRKPASSFCRLHASSSFHNYAGPSLMILLNRETENERFAASNGGGVGQDTLSHPTYPNPVLVAWLLLPHLKR